MKISDQYHKWVEWSEEDGVYVGKCPDLITGIHGGDPKKVYADLCEVIDEVIAHFEADAGSCVVLPAEQLDADAHWQDIGSEVFTLLTGASSPKCDSRHSAAP